MPFSPADIADALAHGLAHAEGELRREESPRGLDALEETALHPLLASGLRAHGLGAHLEQRYPHARAERRRSHGPRCDLVVTPDARALAAPDDAPSLFAPRDAVPLAEALWLEVKTARLYHGEGPNPRYVAELLGAPSEDIVRLGTAPEVRHAMVALLVFARTEEEGRTHLAEWERAMRVEGLPLDTPRVRAVPISDRVGHAACMVAVAEVGRIA
jgi:hypothetical protein